MSTECSQQVVFSQFTFPSGTRRGNETTNCTPDELSRSCYSTGSPARSMSSSCEENSNPETHAPTTKVQKSKVQWPLVTLSPVETPGNWCVFCQWHFHICN